MPDSLQIHTDSQTRHLYANDASMYEEVPDGVCFPQTGADIQALVKQANRESFSITPRSGGTSLAGQTTGNGVIMDTSRFMNRILEVNSDEQYAHVQPGVIRDTLNRAVDDDGLFFGPDTATTNRCMLGGMIGNNSCGLFSIKHKTTREHIISVKAVLSDGSTAVFEPLSRDQLEQKKQLDNLEGHIYRSILELVDQHRDQIIEAYPHPEITRRNTGYALDKLCSMQPFNPDGRPFNMAELLCGSEGTLAMTLSAKVRLVPQEPHRLLVVPHFDSINEAMEATVEAVKHDPAAVELVDDIILDATKDNIEQRKNRFFLEGEPKCILIIQFEGSDLSSLQQKAEKLSKIFQDNGHTETAPIIKENDEIERVWDLRKAGLGLLMGLGADERTPSFCEDTAVRVADLPAYVKEFQKLLKKHDTSCVFYAHASVGELHLRPVIDTSKPEGIQTMRTMANEIAALVHQFNGSLSGEHGDGRSRAPYIPKVLGQEMMPLLQMVKETWDPDYIFNPGKIVHSKNIEDDLRLSSFKVHDLSIDTQFQWRREGGFSEALDFCNGAGVCRKRAGSGGAMCPSYMASLEEKDSTRGRANLFRQFFAEDNTDAFNSQELKDALDTCLSCKACKSECPANVDMARMKAEFMQGWHERNGVTGSEWFFGNAPSIYPLASIFPKLSNRMMKTPVGKELLFQFFNIHRERDLPSFAPQTFRKWFKNYPTADSAVRGKAALLIDPFVNYHEPDIGKAAVKVLEALGYEAVIPDVTTTGRTLLSKGLTKKAKKVVHKNLPELYRLAEDDIPIIGLEPSEILTLRDEYVGLCDDDFLPQAKLVAKNSFEFEEFFSEAVSANPEQKELFEETAKTVHLHGHCHARSLVGDEPTLEALAAAGYKPKSMRTGCCGMAGSFGYEVNHYDMSMDIGDLVLFPAIDAMDPEEELLCAPGFSCRHQIADGTGAKSYHPAELIAATLKE